MSFLFGLALGGVYHAFFVTKKPVSSYLAISPLPASRRYIFCGTFPWVSPAWRYQAPFSVESGLSSSHKTCSCNIAEPIFISIEVLGQDSVYVNYLGG